MLVERSKKIIAMILVLVLLAAMLTACGKGSVDVTESTGTQTSSSVTGSQPVNTEAASLEPYEFTLYYPVVGVDTSNKWGDDAVSAYVKEKLNITMKLEAPQNDAMQELNLMLASGGKLPDAFMFSSWNETFFKLINLKKLVPIDEYIEKYGHYRDIVDESTRNLAKIDGKTYCFMSWATNRNQPTGNSAWMYNKNIYEQLGSPAMTTTDDLYNYLKKVKEAGVKVDGKEVVPLQPGEMSWGGISMLLASFGINYNNNVYSLNAPVSFFSQPNYDVPADAGLKLFMTHPRFEEAMVFINRLWREGLIGKDYFTETHEQIKEKLSNGRVAMYTSANVITAIGIEARAALLQKDPTNDYTWFDPPAAAGLNNSDIKYNQASMLGIPLTVTVDAEKPDRIVQLWDYLFSTEGSRITYYGPPGVMYTEWDENDIPDLKKMYGELTAEERDSLGIYRWWYPGNAAYGGKSVVVINDRMPAEKKDWNTEIQKNTSWPRVWDGTAYHMTFPDPKSNEGIKYTSASDEINKALPKIITAESEEQCKEAIKQAIDTIYSLGYEEVEKSMTEKWKANLAKIK